MVSSVAPVASSVGKAATVLHPETVSVTGNIPPPKPVKIDMEEIIDEIHLWESVVVCYVIG